MAGGAPALQYFSCASCGLQCLLHLHFLPNAAFLFPVVERFAIDFVNGGFGATQFAGDTLVNCDRNFNVGVHSLTDRSRRAFAITETELKLIAAPAIIGLRRTPKNG